MIASVFGVLKFPPRPVFLIFTGTVPAKERTIGTSESIHHRGTTEGGCRPSIVGRLSNYDDDHNDDFNKTTIGLMIKTTVLHVRHVFNTFLWRPLHDYDVEAAELPQDLTNR